MVLREGRTPILVMTSLHIIRYSLSKLTTYMYPRAFPLICEQTRIATLVSLNLMSMKKRPEINQTETEINIQKTKYNDECNWNLLLQK